MNHSFETVSYAYIEHYSSVKQREDEAYSNANRRILSGLQSEPPASQEDSHDGS